jgi:hypothetical protein
MPIPTLACMPPTGVLEVYPEFIKGSQKLLTLAYLDYGFSAIGSIWLFNILPL